MTTKEMLAIVDKMHDQPCPYGIGGTALEWTKGDENNDS